MIIVQIEKGLANKKKQIVEHNYIKLDAAKLVNVLEHSLNAFFLRYYEAYFPSVAAHANFDKLAYADPWGFARLIRNAITHNSINIRDKNAADITWRGITIGLKDNKKSLIDKKISNSDLIMLMLDMDQALDVSLIPII